MAHPRTVNYERSAAIRGLPVLVALAAGSCIGDPSDAPSLWPPPDFELSVEEFATGGAGVCAVRSLLVLPDGTALFRLAPQALVDPGGEFVLPVYRAVSGYRMLPEALRVLSRRLHLEGFFRLDAVQGDQRVTKGTSFRIEARAFGESHTVVASGIVHGALVRVVRTVNGFLPAGQQFAPPGSHGDDRRQVLCGVPEPRDDLDGALQFTESVARAHPERAGLWLDSYALACAAGDRARALSLLDRWEAAEGRRPREQQLFPEQGAAVGRQQLLSVLPP